MGYRQLKPPEHHHRRDMDNKTTGGRIFLEPGTVAVFSIPCWYRMVGWPIQVHGHDRMFHDHIGWPSPDHPDHSCQAWDFDHTCCRHGHAVCEPKRCHDYIDMCKLAPIHLTKEGYTACASVSDIPVPDKMQLEWPNIDYVDPQYSDLQQAYEQMGEDDFEVFRRWYISKRMNVSAEASIRKNQDWVVDLKLSVPAVDTDWPPFDTAEKLITVGVSRKFDNSSDIKRELVGKYVATVHGQAAEPR